MKVLSIRMMMIMVDICLRQRWVIFKFFWGKICTVRSFFGEFLKNLFYKNKTQD